MKQKQHFGLWCGRLAGTIRLERPHHDKTQRRGLTLVELLVVISIIGLLGGIIGLIAPRFAERSRVAEGSRQLRSWLMIAKQRALRDKAPRGLRFAGVASQTSSGALPSAFYNKFAYVEQPEDITGMPSEIAPAANATLLAQVRRQFQQEVGTRLRTAAGDTASFTPVQRAKFAAYMGLIDPSMPANVNNWTYLLWLKDKDLSEGTVISDNDIVEFAGARYSVVYKPMRITGQPGSVIVLNRPRDEARASLNQMTVAPLTSYRITRLPRPIAGEPELTLPKNIAVDILYTNKYSPPSASYPPSTLTRSLPAPDVQDPASSLAFEMIFSPSGEVTGSLANTGRIVLWLRDITLADTSPMTTPPDGENRLLVIHTKTGQVTSHSICTDIDSTTGLPDWYRFIRDGKSSALED